MSPRCSGFQSSFARARPLQRRHGSGLPPRRARACADRRTRRRAGPAASSTTQPVDPVINTRMASSPVFRWRPVSASILAMKRQLIAVIVMLAIGLQGSVVAFSGISPLMPTDCQTAAISNSDAAQDSCCPKGQHSMSCCLEACAGTVAGAVTVIPQALNWNGHATLLPQFRSTHFSSRGDSPLIRPPIL
jgi:hypothetical protein